LQCARADNVVVTIRPRTSAPESVPVSDVFAALSFSLDLTEGQPMGHALRSCMIAMELGGRLGLPLQLRRDLYYAAMLKDAGCSSNAARVFSLFGGDDRLMKGARMQVDWSNYFRAAFYARERRAGRRGSRAPDRQLATAAAHRGAGGRAAGAAPRSSAAGLGAGRGRCALDEHWDGRGHPRGLGRRDPDRRAYPDAGADARGVRDARRRDARAAVVATAGAGSTARGRGVRGLGPPGQWCALETHELKRWSRRAGRRGAARRRARGGPHRRGVRADRGRQVAVHRRALAAHANLAGHLRKPAGTPAIADAAREAAATSASCGRTRSSTSPRR
jgi:hypothetical protein